MKFINYLEVIKMKHFCLVVLLILFTGVVFGEIINEDSSNQFKAKNYSVYLDLGWGGLLSGKLYDLGKKSLTPSPDSISDMKLGIGFDWYMMQNFGLSLSYDFLGTISAKSSKVTRPLSIGNVGSISLQMIGRIPVFSDSSSTYYIKLFAGPNFNYFDLSSDYKSLFRGLNWYAGPAMGFGAAGGIGLLVQYEAFDIGGDVFVQYKSFKYADAPQAIDFADVGLNMRIGLDF
jgi:hypothetical protein